MAAMKQVVMHDVVSVFPHVFFMAMGEENRSHFATGYAGVSFVSFNVAIVHNRFWQHVLLPCALCIF